MSDIFDDKPKIINIGLEIFYEDLKELSVDVVHVEWKAPNRSEKAKQLLKLLLSEED